MHCGSKPIASEYVQSVTLIRQGRDIRSEKRHSILTYQIAFAGIGQRVSDPTRQPVGSSALQDELRASGVTVLEGDETMWREDRIAVVGAVHGTRGIRLTIKKHRPNPRALSDALLHACRVVVCRLQDLKSRTAQTSP